MVYLESELWSKRYAKNFDDSSDEEYSREQEIQKIEYKVNNFFFLNITNVYVSNHTQADARARANMLRIIVIYIIISFMSYMYKLFLAEFKARTFWSYGISTYNITPIN